MRLSILTAIAAFGSAALGSPVSLEVLSQDSQHVPIRNYLPGDCSEASVTPEGMLRTKCPGNGSGPGHKEVKSVLDLRLCVDWVNGTMVNRNK